MIDKSLRIMKILFLTYHGFDNSSGISKKMLAQIKGLRENGHEVHVCSFSIEPNGDRCRYIDDIIIQNFGQTKWSTIQHRYDFKRVIGYCKDAHIEMVYARSFMNASPSVIRLFKAFNRLGIKSVIEIPTYPYDQELSMLPFKHKIQLYIDKIFRKKLAAKTNAIVTFAEDKEIFGQHTINISNGIDFDTIPLHKSVNFTKELHIIAVAEVHPWHGFDRFIEGLGLYCQENGDSTLPVYLHIVGSVWPPEMYGSKYAPGFATHIKKYNIEKYVIFHGKLFGEELNSVFDKCSFAVGSLGRHRSGITRIKTLKNREYAARGIPFIYSEIDSDFDNKPYIIKAPADETPININKIIQFINEITITPDQIRQTVKNLSWQSQMKIVTDYLQTVK